MKYKAGDKVRIKDLETLPQVLRGRVMQIKRVYSNNYDMTELLCPVFWTDELIEGLVEEEPSIKGAPIWPIHWHNVDFSNEIACPDGYQFKDENGNVINATKIVLEKKKKEYPKTYEECRGVIGPLAYKQPIIGYKSGLLSSLQTLLICRDAYWEIAGEKMGLGKPWKPSWDKCTGDKYCIFSVLNILRHNVFSNSEDNNRILAFPTEEMRDAFYENFKELIKSCKELL